MIDSYLDNTLPAVERVEITWYVVFFLHFWHQWLLLNPRYSLSNNFITTNAYTCVELNAHSLITFLITVREFFPPNSQCFLPWTLGSQSCEKMFRTCCSMSSAFSTVINFGMLCLFRRLHRVYIQYCLEFKSETTQITYPRLEAHKKRTVKSTKGTN